jgi:hypothetical protein
MRSGAIGSGHLLIRQPTKTWKGKSSMKNNAKANKAKDKTNNNGSGPMLKFNHVKRETLPQT